MTPEQRFDRLERIVRLMIKAGLRARTQSREQNEKINILINSQIRNDEQFAKHEQRLAKLEQQSAEFDKLFARNDERFAGLLEEQKRTGERLDKLIESISKRNGV